MSDTQQAAPPLTDAMYEAAKTAWFANERQLFPLRMRVALTAALYASLPTADQQTPLRDEQFCPHGIDWSDKCLRCGRGFGIPPLRDEQTPLPAERDAARYRFVRDYCAILLNGVSIWDDDELDHLMNGPNPADAIASQAGPES